MSTDRNQDSHEFAQHFTDVALDYHSNPVFQSSAYEQWINTIMFDALDLKGKHILFDAGCGSGKDCLWLLNKMNNEINVIGNDISSGMIKIFDNEIKTRNLTNVVKTFCMNAATFSQEKQLPTYHRVLLKQFIHLLSHNERILAFRGFHQKLSSIDNKLVIMGRPSKEIFPLDKRTQDMFTSMTPSFDTYVEELEMCGFTNIQYDIYPYTFDDNVTLDDWINIIQKRLWSSFSRDHMNEEEMADCITFLKEAYKNQPFQLKDEMVVLHCTAKKQQHHD
ncbi:unnamed protein product [Adineta steineri]|uniref:Methyltransferase domain-containing protein n=1 Tax=Adineta steineri TaxID=433720 RepID=A0A819DC62_9BILA|nr:unnamed protein product [Adineta steineri]CAF0737167.1 unnamed protein product [Adineta steineri]CAF3664250.1 unnamed protein product [Adineta steineri]CAF3821351.1 unnamed protein product [Adineta steineri]